MNERSITDSALDLLQARQWAGPDSNPSFERFLMSQSAPRSRRPRAARTIFVIAVGGLALSAAAAGVYQRWVTVRPSDGPDRAVMAVENGDQTLTLIEKDGARTTAYMIPKEDSAAQASSTDNDEIFEIDDGADEIFAVVADTVLDENGNPIAVTHEPPVPPPAPDND